MLERLVGTLIAKNLILTSPLNCSLMNTTWLECSSITWGTTASKLKRRLQVLQPNQERSCSWYPLSILTTKKSTRDFSSWNTLLPFLTSKSLSTNLTLFTTSWLLNLRSPQTKKNSSHGVRAPASNPRCQLLSSTWTRWVSSSLRRWRARNWMWRT